MEIDSAIRNADNRIIAAMAVAFAGLVFTIGIAANDVPGDVPISEATFDVAPPIATPVQPAADAAQAGPTSPLAHLATVAAIVPKKDERWYADDAAQGARPDSQH